MLSQNVLVLSCVLLLLTLCPDVLSRRGFGGIGGRWGGIRKAGGGGGARRGGEARGIGGGPHYKVAHANGGSSSSGSSAGKMAGAAAAGAVGGMMIGHGHGSMSRPGYGHGGYGGYGGYGYGGGHGQVRYDNGAGFRNETYMEYYTGAASRGLTYSCVLLFGATVSLLIRF
ncbi:glycine-rich cell wall structural protein 1.8 [Tachysurus fulvidraco]|uniref:glycine-rich cell wall structural protein 1.8 n=1 Tax=Tachysurus fulvidraco TaxID=1234273 RepID=UPI001FEF32A8|nr:glycine-rich cell wall structural protein 1.8 [Tachysurus fulvidraco]